MRCRWIGVLVVAGLALAACAGDAPAANVSSSGVSRVEAAARPPVEQRRLGICLSAPRPSEVDRFCAFVAKRLASDGFDTLVLLVRYGYQFKSNPNCAASGALDENAMRKIVAACREAKITLIPKMNLLGHQGSAAAVGAGPLKAYPDMDESRGRTNIVRNYCRSICPQHPMAMRLVCDLMDELVDVCEAKAVHIGCDEVFELGMCERCRDQKTADLFAHWVNGLIRHNRARGVQTLMWGDRLLDSAKTRYGVWEASDNGSAAAISQIDRDVILCDWHYEKCAAYPSVETFGDAGFKAWICPWRYLDHARLFIDYANGHERGGNLVGLMLTTWHPFADVADAIEGRELRSGIKEDLAKTLRCIAEVYRAYRRPR